MSVLKQNDSKFTSILLFSDISFDNNKITFILYVTMDYIFSTRRSYEILFNSSGLSEIGFCKYYVINKNFNQYGYYFFI